MKTASPLRILTPCGESRGMAALAGVLLPITTCCSWLRSLRRRAATVMTTPRAAAVADTNAHVIFTLLFSTTPFFVHVGHADVWLTLDFPKDADAAARLHTDSWSWRICLHAERPSRRRRTLPTRAHARAMQAAWRFFAATAIVFMDLVNAVLPVAAAGDCDA